MINDVQTAIRLPKGLVRLLDSFAKAKSAETGVTVSRAAAIRLLVTEGLQKHKFEFSPTYGKRSVR